MGFAYFLIKLLMRSHWILIHVLVIVREKMVVRERCNSFEKYLSRFCMLLFGKSAKKNREKEKEGTEIKVDCFLHSLRRFPLFFSRHNEPTISWVLRRHENCFAKIRYNHCRRARGETDSFRMSRERTAGNPSGGCVLFFTCFHFEDTLSYHPGKGLRMTSFWSAFLARSFNFDASGNIAYVVDAARWSSKSISVLKRRKIMLSIVLVIFILFRNTVSLSIHEHGFVSECREYVATFPFVLCDVCVEGGITGYEVDAEANVLTKRYVSLGTNGRCIYEI